MNIDIIETINEIDNIVNGKYELNDKTIIDAIKPKYKDITEWLGQEIVKYTKEEIDELYGVHLDKLDFQVLKDEDGSNKYVINAEMKF